MEWIWVGVAFSCIVLMEAACVLSHKTREAGCFVAHMGFAGVLGMIAHGWLGLGYAGYVLLAWATIDLGMFRRKLIPYHRWPTNWDWWHLLSALSHWPVGIVSWARVGIDLIQGSWIRGLLFLVLSCILGATTKLVWIKLRKKSWPTLTEQWDEQQRI